MPLRFAEPADEAYAYPLTLRHLLETALITARDQEIIYRDVVRLTYADLRQRVGRLASMLKSLGAKEGMTIAVMDWDSHRYLEAYFAIPMMGAVLQTVNVRLPTPQLAYTLNHAKAEILLVHSDFLPIVESILPSLPHVQKVVTILEGADRQLPGFAVGDYEELCAPMPDYPFEDFDENAVATTFYTTGTTGSPKGVCFTHRQLVLQALVNKGPFGSSGASFSLGVGDVYMPLTPMFHVHAWGVPYLATLLGLKQVYPGRYEPDMICRLRRNHNVTYSHCVPTILQMILQSAEKTGVDLTGWKMTIGGSALTHSLCEKGRRKGMNVAAGYGMSETCPTVSIARRQPESESEEAIVDDLTSAGTPIPLVYARIVDDCMNDIPKDGVSRGELVLRSPWLTPCYTGNAEASKELWRGGWLHTQDVATIDRRGVIRIRDRLKDVIKSGGEWINSLELEDMLATVEGVVEAAVIAVSDERWGERPLALVVTAPGQVMTLEALNAPVERAIASGAITRYARLDRFEQLDALPRTSVGKIDKKKLRADYSN